LEIPAVRYTREVLADGFDCRSFVSALEQATNLPLGGARGEVCIVHAFRQSSVGLGRSGQIVPVFERLRPAPLRIFDGRDARPQRALAKEDEGICQTRGYDAWEVRERLRMQCGRAVLPVRFDLVANDAQLISIGVGDLLTCGYDLALRSLIHEPENTRRG